MVARSFFTRAQSRITGSAVAGTDKVVMIWQMDQQVRHVYLSVPHSAICVVYDRNIGSFVKSYIRRWMRN
jgi:hypothetical protein